MTDLEAQRPTTRSVNPRIKQGAYICVNFIVVYIFWFLFVNGYLVFPSALKKIDVQVLDRVKAMEAVKGSVGAMWRGVSGMVELGATVVGPVVGWMVRNGTVDMVRNGTRGMVVVQGV
jgi:hypothetical protein